jgi:hypothetical protein
MVVPYWVRTLVVLVGITLTIYDTVVQDEPSFFRIVLYAAMMGLLSGDAFERLIGRFSPSTPPPAPPTEGPTEPSPPVTEET